MNRLQKFINEKILGVRVSSQLTTLEQYNYYINRAVTEILANNYLSKDYKLDEMIRDGYERNPDVFSITDRISTMFAGIKYGVYSISGKENKFEGMLEEFIDKPNKYQTWFEYKKNWSLFGLVTGNAIQWNPVFENGNNKGFPVLIRLLPPQDTIIKSDGPSEPVHLYVVDYNDYDKSFPAGEVSHYRFFLNLDHKLGKNFMGISPVNIAANIIESQNAGYALGRNSFSRIGSPGFLVDRPPAGMSADPVTRAEKDKFEQTWREKYSKQNMQGVPGYLRGNFDWLKIGYENMRDLDLINMNRNGVRVLCNVWSVPPELFGDKEASTYNNMQEARKAIYTDRLLPDADGFAGIFTGMIKNINKNLIVKCEKDDIPALQKDMGQMITWIARMVEVGLISRDEGREVSGWEKTNLPGMDIITTGFGQVPVSEISTEIDDDSIDNFERENGKTY